MSKNLNSYQSRDVLSVNGKKYTFHNLKKFEQTSKQNVSRLPFSLKILLENLLRQEDGVVVSQKDINALVNWNAKAEPDTEIQFMPARILLQDFTGVPAVADLAAMRGAIKKLGGDPNKINPLQPADLVIDHSVQVDYSGTSDSFQKNADLEFDRNLERYEFLRWGQSAFKNFRVVPPDTGIVHQVNLEYLATVAMTGEKEGETWVYPDSLVGTDSHTTMINGLGVVGWGVGGIEAEAAMLGQPCTMLIPQVVGYKLSGKLPAGTTATDLVLTVTQALRKKGVVGKFVEFYGPGLENLTLADRATLANMAPEYGATIGIFPVDERTTDYLKLTGRTEVAERVEAYYKAQGLWYTKGQPDAEYSDVLTLDLSTVEACLAGPARPQDRVVLSEVASTFKTQFAGLLQKKPEEVNAAASTSVTYKSETFELKHGSVVIAAITSCTNTSNPTGLITAALLAQKAQTFGLKSKPWVKTSLAPGSKVVTEYLNKAGLMPAMESLGFHLVGYGCTTCIGNSGPLPEAIVKGVVESQLAVSAVLSGNRNFEGRIHPNVRANYLASPALVVAYAIAGNVNVNLSKDPIGKSKDGKDIFLKDIWPTQQEVMDVEKKSVTQSLFQKSYADVFKGDAHWQNLKFPTGDLYKWDSASTYIKEPPFFATLEKEPKAVSDIKGARVLALLKDSITTDHISPAGDISLKGAAGEYLVKCGVKKEDFNSYGARRGNHEVMMRGTFANVRLKNQLTPGIEGGVTKYLPTGKQTTIYDASMEYQANGTPLVVIAGKEYGTGSSRDWAAKGTLLLGVRAVMAESFERIHRSNLVGMGVLPLQFLDGESADKHGLTGTESFEITGLSKVTPGQNIVVKAKREDGTVKEFTMRSRIDTLNEVEYYKNGGILPYVLRQIAKH